MRDLLFGGFIGAALTASAFFFRINRWIVHERRATIARHQLVSDSEALQTAKMRSNWLAAAQSYFAQWHAHHALAGSLDEIAARKYWHQFTAALFCGADPGKHFPAP